MTHTTAASSLHFQNAFSSIADVVYRICSTTCEIHVLPGHPVVGCACYH